jgi:hypothetical protein
MCKVISPSVVEGPLEPPANYSRPAPCCHFKFHSLARSKGPKPAHCLWTRAVITSATTTTTLSSRLLRKCKPLLALCHSTCSTGLASQLPPMREHSIYSSMRSRRSFFSFIHFLPPLHFDAGSTKVHENHITRYLRPMRIEQATLPLWRHDNSLSLDSYSTMSVSRDWALLSRQKHASSAHKLLSTGPDFIISAPRSPFPWTCTHTGLYAVTLRQHLPRF